MPAQAASSKRQPPAQSHTATSLVSGALGPHAPPIGTVGLFAALPATRQPSTTNQFRTITQPTPRHTQPHRTRANRHGCNTPSYAQHPPDRGREGAPQSRKVLIRNVHSCGFQLKHGFLVVSSSHNAQKKKKTITKRTRGRQSRAAQS